MNILLGVSGGIAIYKTLNIIRLLLKEGNNVKVIMTEHSTRFIQPILFKTIANNDVFVNDFDFDSPLAHIELADWADVFAIVPATANTIAKIANGIADNLLTSTFLAFDKRRIIFPVMNTKMFENKATQSNLKKIADVLKYEIIEPANGDLACGYKGKGRLPADDFVVAIINRNPNGILKGKKYIVSAGATREKIDPVRFISNYSTGKMGVSIACSLFKQGADVLLIHGSISIDIPRYINSLAIDSTADMLNVITKNIDSYDGLFMAAAPADFTPKDFHPSKIKKSGDFTAIELDHTPDILKSISDKTHNKLIVGFALESGSATDNDDAIANAKSKLQTKNLDFIVLNTISDDFTPMGSDSNSVVLIGKDGSSKEYNNAPKREIADWLVEQIAHGWHGFWG